MPKEAKMSDEMVVTVIFLLVIVSVSWLGTIILTRFNRRRKRHFAERAVVDYLRKARR
jgi:hypothetical protein